jgi:hypothetical protein
MMQITEDQSIQLFRPAQSVKLPATKPATMPPIQNDAVFKAVFVVSKTKYSVYEGRMLSPCITDAGHPF